MSLLKIRDLSVGFSRGVAHMRAVDSASLSVESGEVLALVGESGSGKSVTVMSVLGLTRTANATISGSITFHGEELLTATERELDKVRGARIAMIFQDPMTALNPVHRVGAQIAEQIRAHERISRKAAWARAVELLATVGIPSAQERARCYPHEFSGGMRQRVMIAMALSTSPELLIADEPTTALDVTVQAQILKELRELCVSHGTGILIVTHDLSVVADIADRVAVMYAGRVVEQASVNDLFYDPLHPYTWGLMGAIPRSDRARQRRLTTIAGGPPPLEDPIVGCSFRLRCPHAYDECGIEPALIDHVAGEAEHLDRCWLSVEAKRELRKRPPLVVPTHGT